MSKDQPQVLMVDDRPENLLALEAILAPLEAKLVQARSGREALRHLLKDDFALILLDIQMPEMDGYETAVLIRQRPRSASTPIIFLTAADESKTQLFRGYEAGAVDFIFKPIDPNTLRSKVRVFIDMQRLTNQLRGLAVELTQVEQRERKRLASILHDHLQQLLVAGLMQIELLEKGSGDAPLKSALDKIRSVFKEAIEVARSLTVELSPPILYEAGLAKAITWLGSRFEEKYQFKVEMQADPEAEPAREEVRLLLFESVRELLFNALKHSGAREAVVSMQLEEGNTIRVVVRDQGKGFLLGENSDRPKQLESFGLFSIQQRLAHLGGRMAIESEPQQGTTVTLRVPDGESPERESRLAGTESLMPARGSASV